MTKRRTTRGTLRYNETTDRFHLCAEHAVLPLHCGEGIALRFREEFTWGRMEVDGNGDWYVIFTLSDKSSTKLTLRRNSTYEAMTYS
ncbi:DUF5348 domain-containing protein [Alicyclobacillus fodiniaquatilis]|uniref:DUF5348 domain-containing protein n=1 Tax=Alicyclobacillus fodiniaquatilis TaxID=1661150 RepID=A0ABW4JC41_9BACL